MARISLKGLHFFYLYATQSSGGYFTVKAMINKLNNENILDGLTVNGYSGRKEFNSEVFDNNRIEEIRMLIRTHLLPTKNISSSGSAYSYHLKHILERYSFYTNNQVVGNYISNGECIYAMFLEGYSIKPENDGLNAYFNVSERSVDVLTKIVDRLK